MMNWKIFVLFATLFEQGLNQYLNFRQSKQLKIKSIPPTLASYNITTPEQFVKSQIYGYDKLLFNRTRLSINLIISLAMLYYNFMPFMWNLVSSFTINTLGYENETLISILFFFQFYILLSIIETPFGLYYAFVLEEKHGFNRITLKLFIKDKIIELLLMVLISTPIIAGLIYIVKWSGPFFWFYSWLMVAAVSFLMITIYPSFIAPLFNKYTPVEGELSDAIFALAKRVEFPATKLFIIDASKRSSHMNAYFYGFFKNKRIVLYDTLIKELNQQEILGVLCHEFGHYKKRHTLILIAIQQFYLLLFFYLFGLFVNNIQLFNDFGFTHNHTFIGLLLFSYIYTPMDQMFTFVSNIFSRAFEYQADDYAIGMGFDLTDGLVKLCIKDHSSLLVDSWYSTYHYTHPTLLERLKNIKSKLSTTKKTQ